MQCIFATTEGEPVATTFGVRDAGHFGLILFTLQAELANSLLTARRSIRHWSLVKVIQRKSWISSGVVLLFTGELNG